MFNDHSKTRNHDHSCNLYDSSDKKMGSLYNNFVQAVVNMKHTVNYMRQQYCPSQILFSLRHRQTNEILGSRKSAKRWHTVNILIHFLFKYCRTTVTPRQVVAITLMEHLCWQGVESLSVVCPPVALRKNLSPLKSLFAQVRVISWNYPSIDSIIIYTIWWLILSPCQITYYRLPVNFRSQLFGHGSYSSRSRISGDCKGWR